ncbi:UNVERIFIED_CONTAM: hypothetical protein GTU68_029363 [Idotea baltica]|nr:hypothetical protein [Idotea baltica]
MSRIQIKTQEDIKLLKTACEVTKTILDEVGSIVKPGVSTGAINDFVHNMTTKLGAVPAPLNYKGFPASVCTSVNEVVCHGIPDPYHILKEGDIINIDITSIKNGFYGDSSRMYFVGGREACSKEVIDLVDITKESLFKGIEEVAPGKNIGDIGAGIQKYIESLDKNYGIVREYTGHGIGKSFHEEPQVLHFGHYGEGPKIKEGMTFTIEPMINIGGWKTKLSQIDGWTVRTADNSLSAQWEHTLVVTNDSYEILT